MAGSERKKVQVWLYADGEKGESGPRFLLLKTTPERGAFWQPVTGGVEEGEEPVDAAQREAVEETGLPFLGGPQDLSHTFRFESRGRVFREFAFALTVKASNGTPNPRLDPKEHVDYRWVSAQEALAMVHHESNREVLSKLLERLEVEKFK